jgi:hydroxymethylpyrimidine/phosphomethylpyrimidine kinase
MIKAGKILISLGAKNVLIKGGHLKSRQMNDILLNIKKLLRCLKAKNTILKKHSWNWLYIILCNSNVFIMWKRFD